MFRSRLPGQFSVCFVVCLLTALPARAASPRLSSITPGGIKRGAEHTVQFNGTSLEDIEEILFYEPAGFSVTKIEPNGNNPNVTINVTPDCRLGEHVAQVRTKSGVSDYRTFYVEDLPAVDEIEPNSEFASPQAIPLNIVVNGSISNEDVDYFVVEAKQGQRISVEVVAMRLSTALFDPYVAILDSKRFELSANDDTALALQDAYASIVAPEDGHYVIEIRESAYAAGSSYRLHVGTFPRPSAVYPAGGKMGEETEVRFLGLPAGDVMSKVTLPAQPVTDFAVFASDEGGVSPTGNTFQLFEHGNAFEQEPNNDQAQATQLELPLAFNGIIQEPGDVDFFKFTAKQGEQFEVECFARRIRSGLDPVLNLYNADGSGITGNDDSRGPDSYFRFAVPADGEYVLRVADHLGRGGPDLVYRVEFQPVRPSLTLGIPRVERYGQYRQQIYVPKGGRFGVIINAARVNFGGDLILEADDLPAGLQMVSEPMPANQPSMPVVFEAAAEAQLAGKLVDLKARHADPNQNIQGGFRNRADYIIAEPNQSLYRWKDVDRLAICVVDEIPFSLEIVEPKVPLVRDGTMQLKIVAHKKEGWDEPISIEFPYRPPGVGAATAVTLEKGQTEAFYPLNANGDAEIKHWKVFALGTSGGMWGSSQLANLEVADPFARLEIQRAACEQGQTTQVLCKVNHIRAFEGTATAALLGLPPKTSAEALPLTKESQEVVFTVKTEPDSPVGKHNLICQLVMTQNEEPVVSTAGGVQLQIDQPLPAPAEQSQPAPMPETAATQPVPAAVAETPAKPLSRLEKLRLAAKERQDARQSGGSSDGE